MYYDQNGNPIGNVPTDQATGRGLQVTPGAPADMQARILIELQVISHLLSEARVSEDLTTLRNNFAASLFTAS